MAEKLKFPTNSQELDQTFATMRASGATDDDLKNLFNEYKRRKSAPIVSSTPSTPTKPQVAPVMGPAVPAELEAQANVKQAAEALHNATIPGMVENTVREGAKGLWNAGKGLVEGGKELLKGGGGDPMKGAMTSAEGLLQTVFSPVSAVVKALPENDGITGAPRKIIDKVGALPADAGKWITNKLGEYLGADTTSPDWQEKVVRPVTDAINIGAAIYSAKGRKVGEIVDKSLEAVSNFEKKGAQKNVETILNPTKQASKAAVRTKGTEMLDAMPIALSREGLLNKLDKVEQKFGKQIGDYKEMVGIDGQVTRQHLLDVLEKGKLQEKFIDEKGRILDPDGVKAVDTVKEILQQYPETIPLAELDPLRQSLGMQVQRSKGRFDMPVEEQTKQGQKRKLYGEIADQTAEQNPALAKINKPYSMARKTGDILDETLLRKTGQKNLIDKVVKYGPAVTGAIAGGAALSGILTVPALIGAGITGLVAVSRSTLWNLLSGKTKLKISKAILKGKPALVNAADFAEISAIAGQAIKNNQLKPEDVDLLKGSIKPKAE